MPDSVENGVNDRHPTGNGTDKITSSDSYSENASTSSDGDVHGGVKRDPFLAFIPQLGAYSASVIGGELRTAKNAALNFPFWSKLYVHESVRFYRSNPKVLYKEIISGFTVAIMQVPESIAFSFVAGVPPQSGLYATFWMATITGLMGGKPGMISGAAGALAVVVANLTSDDGDLSHLTTAQRLNVLYMTMVVCGAFQIAFAFLRLAKLVRLIPETGMIGFMNGLAIIIFTAQLPAFQKCDDAELFMDCTVKQRKWLTFQDDTWQLVLTLVHVFGCMVIMHFFPRLPKIGRIVPASLVALLVGTLIEHTLFRNTFGVDTRTVEETATMSGDLPKFDWPSIPSDSDTVSTMITYAVMLAAIGGVESVLTLQACNEITDTVPSVSDSNQELFAQGLANLVSGLFRAMGGDAMIGQSTINIMNGARHRVSSTTSGIFMFLFIIALSPFIELLPVGTLTGVLFMVVLSTFQWKTFIILRYGRLSDSAVILLVTLIAVFFNLAIAIAAGVIFSALMHSWDSGAHVQADVLHKNMIVDGAKTKVKYVHLKGTLFFGSARHFIAFFSVSDDPDCVIIDFKDALIIDHSAVAAIQGITHRFGRVGKRVLLVNVAKKCHGRLQRTGDHEQLKSQITPSSAIANVGGGGEQQWQMDEESAAARNGEEEPGVAHANAEGGPLAMPAPIGQLPMFQLPVDGVEVELLQLDHNQRRASIHETTSPSVSLHETTSLLEDQGQDQGHAEFTLIHRASSS